MSIKGSKQKLAVLLYRDELPEKQAMRSIVVYYSMTGNTKIIARAIQQGIGRDCDLAPLDKTNAADLLDYELIGIGAPVIGYREPQIVTDFIKGLPSLKGRYAFVFCTHGTCPSGYIAEMVGALRKKGLKVTGWNDWYGSAFMPYIARPYYTDGHPDDVDVEEAQEFGKAIRERTLRIAGGERGLVPRLPRKDLYDRLYGTKPVLAELPEDLSIPPEDWEKLKPELVPEKCSSCGLCVDNCPNHAIAMDDPISISRKTCGPCHVWFCEEVCPTGAIKVNWEPMEIRDKSTRIYFAKLAESMMKYKDLRRFRPLFPPAEEGTKEPLSRRKHHPRLEVHDGIAKILDESNED
jgi:flavodoxin/ferredoxin